MSIVNTRSQSKSGRSDDRLRNLVDKSLNNIARLLSYCKNVAKFISYDDLTQIERGLRLLKKDLYENLIPDDQIETSIANIENMHLNSIDSDSIQRINESKSIDDEMAKNLKLIRNGVGFFRIYRVLSAIKFTQRNTVIVGPNGCGKTTLANNFTSNIHKSIGTVIPAQKLLFIPNITGIPLPNEVDEAYNSFQIVPRDTKTTYEYKAGGDFPFDMVRKFGDEMQNVMLKYYADIYKVKTDLFHAVRKDRKSHCETKADRAIEIWNYLMEERRLVLDKDDHFAVEYKQDSYPAYMMSEGERNILYLIGRVLFAPKNGYIIVDEPELYLHKTIVNKLWDKLEHERTDCKFIYLTHDLDFAISRDADKCWIRRFDYPDNWDIEAIVGTEIPDDLFLKIIGSRKKILFCEGAKDSLDIKILELIFPDYTITPVGSCTEVINYTKAFNHFPSRLADAYGIIDRDVRPQGQIESLMLDKIYTYKVAEVENLFLTEDFILKFAKYMRSEDMLDIEELKRKIISVFRTQIDKHALDYVSAYINYYFQEQKFHTAKSFSALSDSFDTFKNAIDIQEIYDKRKSYLTAICDDNNYESVIMCVNHKGLSREVENMLKIKDYIGRALRFLQKDNSSNILTIFFPSELF